MQTITFNDKEAIEALRRVYRGLATPLSCPTEVSMSHSVRLLAFAFAATTIAEPIGRSHKSPGARRLGGS